MADEDQSPKLPRDYAQLKKLAEEGKIEALTRPITEDEIYWVLSRWPYLELCDSREPEDVKPAKAVRVTETAVGWKVHDYGNILRTSQNEMLSIKQFEILSGTPGIDEEDEEGGGLGELTRDGTIVQQMVDVAAELIALAKERGWPAVRIMRGFYGMQRAAWVAAQMQEYKLEGFEPGPEDRVVYSWAKRLSSDRKSPSARKPSAGRGL